VRRLAEIDDAAGRGARTGPSETFGRRAPKPERLLPDATQTGADPRAATVKSRVCTVLMAASVGWHCACGLRLAVCHPNRPFVLADYLGERMLVVPGRGAHERQQARTAGPCVRAITPDPIPWRLHCAGTRPDANCAEAAACRDQKAGQTAQKIDQEILTENSFAIAGGQAQPPPQSPRR